MKFKQTYIFPNNAPSGDHLASTLSKVQALLTFRAATGASLRFSYDSFNASFGDGANIFITFQELGEWIKAYYERCQGRKQQLGGTYDYSHK